MTQSHRCSAGSIDTRSPGRPLELLSIEALRWISALLVTVLHADHERLKLAGRSSDIVLTHHVFESGIGVDIFFFISGFLMYHVCRGHFATAGYPWDYFKRRLLRIVPLYWLATCGMLAAILAVPSLLNLHVLGAVHTTMSFLIVAWPDAEGHLFPVLNSGWTLNLELYFYLVFALALRFREPIGVTLVAAWLVAVMLIAHIWPNPPWWLDFYGQSIGMEFAAGLLLGVLQARGLRITRWMAVIMGCAALLLHAGLRTTWPDVPRLLGNGLPAGLLFFACVFSRGLALPRSVEAILRALGRSSYALYLISPFVISAVCEALFRAGLQGAVALVGAACVASALAAWAVSRWIERPLARVGRRLLFRNDRRLQNGEDGNAAHSDPRLERRVTM